MAYGPWQHQFKGNLYNSSMSADTIEDEFGKERLVESNVTAITFNNSISYKS